MRNKFLSISFLAVFSLAGLVRGLIKLGAKSEAKVGKVLAKSAQVESKIGKVVLDDLPTKMNYSNFSSFHRGAANPGFDDYMYARLISGGIRVGSRYLARTNHYWKDSADQYRVLYISEDLFTVHQALRDLE